MQRTIILKGRCVAYVVRSSARAKHINLTLDPTGALIVSLPKRAKESVIPGLLKEKQEWILSHLDQYLSGEHTLLPAHKGEEQTHYRTYARAYVQRVLSDVNRHYGFAVGKVAVKDHRAQWGSCTSKGDLNFNYRLIFLPEELSRYIIVHELCHISEHNHSKRFWALVAELVPDHRKIEKELGRYHLV